MEIISKFFEKIFLFFAVIGSILIVGVIAWLLWILISDKAIALFLALLASILPVILYIGILSEFLCKKERRWKRSIKNKHKKELCESLDESINVSPSRMPLWMQYRFVRYFNSIPEYIYASDDEKQSIYNEIERSTKKSSGFCRMIQYLNLSTEGIHLTGDLSWLMLSRILLKRRPR